MSKPLKDVLKMIENTKLQPSRIIANQSFIDDLVNWAELEKAAVPRITLDPPCPHCGYDTGHEAGTSIRAAGEEPMDIFEGLLVCNECCRVVETASGWRQGFTFPDLSNI